MQILSRSANYLFQTINKYDLLNPWKSYLQIIFVDFHFSPLAVSTQKLSILAFSLHDGVCKKDSDLGSFQRKHKLT